MNPLGRHSQTILNLAWGELFFWDGRAASLEEQALGPIESKVEMNQDLDDVIKELSGIEGYRTEFSKVFPGSGINKTNLGKALAAFERTVVSGEAPFDKWVKGNNSAISKSAKRGFVLFNEKAGCAECHSGWRFTDDGFHDIGVADDDLGRYNELKFDVLKHAFKTPTLRNIEHRAPFLHDGSERTLADVIDFYDVGGRAKDRKPSVLIKKLGLTSEEKKDLIAFLRTLTSKDKPVEVPVLPI